MPWRSLLEYTQVCFRPYPYFQGILMKVNSVSYKWVRYSRVNAIHVNHTQTVTRTVATTRRQSFQLSGPLFILWRHFKNQLTYDVLGALRGLIFRQVQSTFINFAWMYKLHKCNDFTQCNFSIAMIPNSVKFEINKPSL